MLTGYGQIKSLKWQQMSSWHMGAKVTYLVQVQGARSEVEECIMVVVAGASQSA
jgi:hypothetical protein